MARSPRRRPARRTAARRPASLKVSESFRAYVLDQLEGVGDVAPKSMFGGVGLYCDAVFFGILARDRLYLKVDSRNLPDYQQAGMKPFKPFPGRAGSMKYYEVPLAVLESPTELAAWARKAIAAASRSPRG
jgi:DNA transformation protein and related proteins